MAKASIPVDLSNPGQIFACLGFLEAADVLLGDAEGGFDWSDEADVRFVLRANGEQSPFAVVLEFLVEAKPVQFAPVTFIEEKGISDSVIPSEISPSRNPEKMALPILFGGVCRPDIELGHWADASSREKFKLYAGNRSAYKIACDMTKGIAQLRERQREDLIKKPFDVLTSTGGSFNFDARGAWTAIDAGYSPNDHKEISVEASPVVELMAAWGLEHARPEEFNIRRVRYAIWETQLPPMLARVALTGAIPSVPIRRFHFELALSGKNKVVTFSHEETNQ